MPIPKILSAGKCYFTGSITLWAIAIAFSKIKINTIIGNKNRTMPLPILIAALEYKLMFSNN
jgi:hypothetical protein